MTTDLWMLVWTAFLSISVPLVYGTGRLQASGGAKWLAGNRDTALDVAPWVKRAERAHLNLIENIGPFAALVLVAHS
ncbi:MAG: MAPEG family protein [Deltaproteobacteria bacterium]